MGNHGPGIVSSDTLTAREPRRWDSGVKGPLLGVDLHCWASQQWHAVNCLSLGVKHLGDSVEPGVPPSWAMGDVDVGDFGSIKPGKGVEEQILRCRHSK